MFAPLGPTKLSVMRRWRRWAELAGPAPNTDRSEIACTAAKCIKLTSFADLGACPATRLHIANPSSHSNITSAASFQTSSRVRPLVFRTVKPWSAPSNS